MILFILIAIGILIYTIFADNWLIYHLKRKTWSVFNTVSTWLLGNVLLNIANIIFVWLISFVLFLGLVFVCPSETSQWQFNINALQDNLVTQGEFRGRYAQRGHIDGELSYFYSRTLSLGEKIEHIPANKTYVQYSDTEHPHVEVHQSCLDIPEWLTKVFWIEHMNSKTTKYYVLVVPEGTITNTGQYEIDME